MVQGAKLSPQFFYRALDLCNKCDLDYRTATNKQLLVELTLIKLCQLFDKATPLPVGGDGGSDALRKVQPVQQQPVATTQAQSQPQAEQPRPAVMVAPAVPTKSHIPPVSQVSSQRNVVSRSAVPQVFINNKEAAAKVAKEKGIDIEQSVSTHRDKAFDEDALLFAWQRFIDAHPREQIIINTMRASLPRKVNDTLYEIEVENQMQVETFNTHRMKIISFLRNCVENDMLAVDIKLNPNIEKPKFWSPQEVVASIRESNPYMDNFIKDFELALA